MIVKGETIALKKSTTKRIAKPKVQKVPKELESVMVPVRKSIKQSPPSEFFVVPTSLPPPLPPVIHLPAVTPPKAPVAWWVYVLMFFFTVSTLGIVGYVMTKHPFEAVVPLVVVSESSSVTVSVPDATLPTSAESSSEPSVNVHSYMSVVTVPAQADFFASDEGVCSFSEAPVSPEEKPLNVSAKTRMDVVLKADIPTDTTDEASFRVELSRIQHVIDAFAKHKMKVTIQLTTPFVHLADKVAVTEVANWAEAGNELAMILDPVALFGSMDPTVLANVPFGSWLLALHKQQIELEDLCDCSVTSWSGGAVYPRLYQAAKELELTTNADWADDGLVPASLSVVNPWTPVQSGSVEQMRSFDPFGAVVYLPNGVYPAQCPQTAFVHIPFSEQNFLYSTKAFYASLASASTDRVNVFRLLINPEGLADVSDDGEFTALNDWLTSVVDPYIKSGNVISSTDSASGAAFVTWLDQNIGKIELK